MENPIKMDDLGGISHHFRKPPYILTSNGTSFRRVCQPFQASHLSPSGRGTQLSEGRAMAICMEHYPRQDVGHRGYRDRSPEV